MTTQSLRLRNSVIATTAALAAMLMTSCVSTRPSSPRQVAMTNPTVTYQYRNDDELIQANQRAIAYCEQTQSLPQAQNFSNDASGRHVVVFECVPGLQRTQTVNSNPPLRYDYRTDSELLDASRNAQIYCSGLGKPQMQSNIVVNSDGSRTVTFDCSPR